MKLKELKDKIIGKKLLNIITLKDSPEITRIIKFLTGEDCYTEVVSAHLLVFQNKIELLYSDFDSDGYRSGSWYLSILKDVLDKGHTKENKLINSIVRDIVYLEQNNYDGKHFFMITTDKYIITLGQDSVHDYYPSNFFSVKETKEKAIEEAQNIITGENIECKSEVKK